MIYLDNAATTQTGERVLNAMIPFFRESYGNASAVYSLARSSKKAVFDARKKCAELIGAYPNEIFFTSGGTESDNWALMGAYDSYVINHSPDGKNIKGHMITTAIEHHAVLRTAEHLAGRGVDVTYVKPDGDGFIDPEDVVRNIRPDTFLVSVMTANNEIGTIQPVSEISERVHALRKDVLVHTDAVQAYGQTDIRMLTGKVDLLSASSHKLCGPKGTGLLYIRDGIKISPFIRGGMQESGRRAGTENVPGIVGFGEASAIASETMEDKINTEVKLRDLFIEKLSAIPDILINGFYAPGDHMKRLPGNISVCIKGIEAESALIMLDRAGICASGGSACATGAMEPSHVLKAIGRADDEAKGSLRFTLSDRNTEEEIIAAVEVMAEITDKLRNGKKHL